MPSRKKRKKLGIDPDILKEAVSLANSLGWRAETFFTETDDKYSLENFGDDFHPDLTSISFSSPTSFLNYLYRLEKEIQRKKRKKKEEE